MAFVQIGNKSGLIDKTGKIDPESFFEMELDDQEMDDGELDDQELDDGESQLEKFLKSIFGDTKS